MVDMAMWRNDRMAFDRIFRYFYTKSDCLWMIAEACEAIGTPMSLVMETNIEKLKARYPEGFEADKSLHRKEGDI